MTVVFVVPTEELAAERAGVLQRAEAGRKPGRYLRVLNWASEYGWSFETWGREWLLAMPRSASSRATGFDAIELPRSVFDDSLNLAGRGSPCDPAITEQLAALAAEWDATRRGWEAQQPLPLDADAFLTRAGWYDGNRGPRLLFDTYYARQLDPAALPRVLNAVWTAAEWVSAALPRREWLAMFRAAGFCSDPPGEASRATN